MCLSIVYTKEEMAKYLKRRPDVIKCYSGRFIRKKTYRPLCYHNRDEVSLAGINTAKATVTYHGYIPHFHLWTTRQAAKKTFLAFDIILTCLVKKEWITAIGKQDGHTVIVSQKAIFPKYPAKVASKKYLRSA